MVILTLKIFPVKFTKHVIILQLGIVQHRRYYIKKLATKNFPIYGISMYVHKYFSSHIHTPSSQAISSTPSPIHNPRQEAYQMRMSATSSLASNQSAATNLKEQLKKGPSDKATESSGDSAQPHHQRYIITTTMKLQCTHVHVLYNKLHVFYVMSIKLHVLYCECKSTIYMYHPARNF